MIRKIIKNTIFYYDPNLKESAKNHRKMPTLSESKFWELLRNSKINGYRFQRQKPLGKFIVDFYCSKLFLAIEIDGSIHDSTKDKDTERSCYLEDANISVIRFSNQTVLSFIESVKATLILKIKQRERELKISQE